MNRSYHNARRSRKLQGEQLDITFPRRGRPTKHRILERCGQQALNFGAGCVRLAGHEEHTAPIGVSQNCDTETLDDALQMTFPIRPMTEDELRAEFERLFPAEG